MYAMFTTGKHQLSVQYQCITYSQEAQKKKKTYIPHFFLYWTDVKATLDCSAYVCAL
jgi:hypothetical protein